MSICSIHHQEREDCPACQITLHSAACCPHFVESHREDGCGHSVDDIFPNLIPVCDCTVPRSQCVPRVWNV